MKCTITLRIQEKGQTACNCLLKWSNRRGCSKGNHFRGESRENGGVLGAVYCYIFRHQQLSKKRFKN